MIKRIQTTLLALLAIAISANAQNISFEVQANEAKISLAGATEMTALQFNLKLPEGMNVDTSNATLGSATDGHTLCIETLDNGDLLFILYSMDLNTFMDGELLRLPIAANNWMIDGDVWLSTIRMASADAVSYSTEDIWYSGEDIASGVQPHSISIENKGLIYNLSGQMVNGKSLNSKLPRGINIKGDKKVLVK